MSEPFVHDRRCHGPCTCDQLIPAEDSDNRCFFCRLAAECPICNPATTTVEAVRPASHNAVKAHRPELLAEALAPKPQPCCPPLQRCPRCDSKEGLAVKLAVLYP